MYFSSARNSGNLDYGNGYTVGSGTAGTSGTWEGDWLDGGAATGIVAGKAGSVLNFGGGGDRQYRHRHRYRAQCGFERPGGYVLVRPERGFEQ